MQLSAFPHPDLALLFARQNKSGFFPTSCPRCGAGASGTAAAGAAKGKQAVIIHLRFGQRLTLCTERHRSGFRSRKQRKKRRQEQEEQNTHTRNHPPTHTDTLAHVPSDTGNSSAGFCSQSVSCSDLSFSRKFSLTSLFVSLRRHSERP